MKAIPTTYAGTNFRSRLEARWAAFFDLAGIAWDYEPVDFDGWTPDFVLRLAAPVYVEVKPVELAENGFLLETYQFAKAECHWRDVYVLKLGARPQVYLIGVLMDPPAGRSAGSLEVYQQIDVKDAERLWRRAGNAVQWRGVSV